MPRPAAVVYACACLGASLLLAIIRSLLAGGWENPGLKMSLIGLLVAICGAVILALYHRRNWMRWLCVSLIALGLAALPWSLASMPAGLDMVFHVMQGLLQLAAAILLVIPDSQAWYARESREPPLAG